MAAGLYYRWPHLFRWLIGAWAASGSPLQIYCMGAAAANKWNVAAFVAGIELSDQAVTDWIRGKLHIVDRINDVGPFNGLLFQLRFYLFLLLK
jgi:hypothetical protein